MKFLKGNEEEEEMEEGEKRKEKGNFLSFPLTLKEDCNINAPFAFKPPCVICEIPVEDSQSLHVLTLSASPSSAHFSSNSDCIL